MGGNAIKTVNVSRFDIDTYNKTKKLLKSLFQDYLIIEYCYDLPNKTDFGDLDVLYQNKTNNNIIDIIKQLFNPIEYHINSTVLSFAYNLNNKYYQIDMIETDNFECFKFYFLYSDVGNIIGKILKFYQVHLGTQGLFVKPIIGGSRKEIILSKDPNIICNFLGVNYDTWNNFESIDEIYNWIKSIKYFNTFVFFENLKYNDKIKVNRKFYQSFLVHIKDSNIISLIEKEDLTSKLINKFNKNNELQQYIIEYENDVNRKKKFNFNKFIKYGYENKEIGITMKSFKNYIEDRFNINFNDWLDLHNDELIEKYIEYYQTH
jgi:hypothetical protein